MKRQCMHCLDPFCVAACPFHALEKDHDNGVVGSWSAESASAAATARWRVRYEIPKFEWEAFNAKIVKCEFCKERLAKGQEPACTFVCPHARPSSSDAATCCCARRISASATSPGKYFEDRVYGEKEAGGTQVLYLSRGGFRQAGTADSCRERASQPLAALVGASAEILHRCPLGFMPSWCATLKKNFREHEAEMNEEHKKTGLIPQL